MITVQLQKEIEASPEIVFDLLADHTQFPKWDPYSIDATLSTGGPIKKGSKGVTVGKLRGRRVESEIYYDAYDRPRFVSGGTISGTAVAQKRLTLERLIELMHHNPRRIYDLPAQPNTHVEIDMSPTTIRNETMFSKVGWTPFAGLEAAGRVVRVVLRGEVVFEDGRVLAQPGNGHLL